jgi:hypothetical protein
MVAKSEYRRYTIDEVKRKVVSALNENSGGLSGVEIAAITGISRMTITKYLNIFATLRLIRQKKIGAVNVWSIEQGTDDYELPANVFEIQQKFMEAISLGNGDWARNILVNVINSKIEDLKVLSDIIAPTVNTFNELYNRGRLGKTERLHLFTLIVEIVDYLRYTLVPAKSKNGVFSIFVAASEDYIFFAKIGALAFQILGFKVLYLGNVEQHIDPFFDIDFQRYTLKLCGNKRGLLITCICSSGEGSLNFLYGVTRAIRAKTRMELKIVLFTPSSFNITVDKFGSDHVVNDLGSLIEWVRENVNV